METVSTLCHSYVCSKPNVHINKEQLLPKCKTLLLSLIYLYIYYNKPYFGNNADKYLKTST